MSQTLQSVLCITTNKYLVRVLVVLLHARFSVVGPIPFLLAAIFFSGHPYIGSTTVLPENSFACLAGQYCTWLANIALAALSIEKWSSENRTNRISVAMTLF